MWTITVYVRSCCYGDVKYPRNYYLLERAQSSQAPHVLGDQPGSCRYVCWWLCDIWVLAFGRRLWLLAINSFSIPLFVLSNTFYYFFPLASLLNLTAISLHQTLATFRPFKHRLVKKKILGVVIVAVWITAGLFTTSVVLSFLNQLSAFEKSKDILLTYFSFFLFCLLIILVSYSSIAIKIVYGNQPHHHGSITRERKLTRTLFVVTIVSLLLTLPHIILLILSLVSSLKFTYITLQLNYFFYFLFFANSFVNPVLYTFRIPEFRRALFSFLLRLFQPQPAQIFPLNEM